MKRLRSFTGGLSQERVEPIRRVGLIRASVILRGREPSRLKSSDKNANEPGSHAGACAYAFDGDLLGTGLPRQAGSG